MSARRRVLLAALLGALVSGGGAYALTGGASARRPVTVELEVRHSRFTPDRLQVAPGTEVRFVVHNGDPIAHELIVGDGAVHLRHERGTEAVHPPVPGEVSLAPGATAETTYVFDRPGTVLFGCHLPGHWDFGMLGAVEVAGP